MRAQRKGGAATTPAAGRGSTSRTACARGRTGANGALHYYALDLPSNNVIGLFNTAGTATHAYHYSPYGETQSSSEPTHDPLRFAARELDAQTGLYYVRARWYDPFLGRFMSEDPIGLEGGINQYAYALNDPVNLSDPTGLWTCDRNDVTNECSNGATLSGITVTVQRGPNSGFSAFLFRSRGVSLMAGFATDEHDPIRDIVLADMAGWTIARKTATPRASRLPSPRAPIYCSWQGAREPCCISRRGHVLPAELRPWRESRAQRWAGLSTSRISPGLLTTWLGRERPG